MSKDTIDGRGGGRGRLSSGRHDPFGGETPGSNKALGYARDRAIGGTSQLANLLGEAGRETYNLGSGAYKQSLGFYGDLMGSAQRQQQALSPAITNINEAGQGAQSAIENRYGRSGGRNMALDDELRRRQGSINAMYAGAPGAAAEALGRLGTEGLTQAGEFGRGATAAYDASGRLTNEALRTRGAASQSRRSFWGNVGRWAGRLAAAYFSGGTTEATPLGDMFTNTGRDDRGGSWAGQPLGRSGGARNWMSQGLSNNMWPTGMRYADALSRQRSQDADSAYARSYEPNRWGS